MCGVAVLGRHPPEEPTHQPAPASGPSPIPRPSPPPTTTPTPAPVVERRGPWVIAAAPAPTPTPLPPVPPRASRRPTATPTVAQCLGYRWSAGQSAAAWGQVLVSIDVVNRCGRILEPAEMGFQIAGYRDAALVQTARGHAFQRLYPDRSETVVIGLPGSIDWYDRITVEVLD